MAAIKWQVFQSTPDIYEHDLREIVKVIDSIREMEKSWGDGFIYQGELTIWSKNEYPLGTLHLDDSQWVFTPHNESDVEVDAPDQNGRSEP